MSLRTNSFLDQVSNTKSQEKETEQEQQIVDQLAAVAESSKLDYDDTISKEDEDWVTCILANYDAERKLELDFMDNFTEMIRAKRCEMDANLGMLQDIVAYSDYKSTSLWKRRFEQPAEELELFQTTTRAMARHLYLLENFRQAEVDRLVAKISNSYRQGLEARNAMHRAILKAVAKEAYTCKQREKRVRKRFKYLYSFK